MARGVGNDIFTKEWQISKPTAYLVGQLLSFRTVTEIGRQSATTI